MLKSMVKFLTPGVAVRLTKGDCIGFVTTVEGVRPDGFIALASHRDDQGLACRHSVNPEHAHEVLEFV